MSLSPARQHRLRIQAEQAAREGGSVRHASGYDLMLLQLAEDRRRLKGVQSTVKKAQIKVELLPRYTAWADGVLAAGGAQQDDVLMYVMLWRIDAGDYAGALEIGRHALRHGWVMPLGNRNVQTVLAEEMADAAQSAMLAAATFDAEPAPKQAEVIKNTPFWPDVSLSEFRSVMRTDGTVTQPRLKQVLLTAISEVNAELYDFRNRHRMLGFQALADVPADVLDGKSERIQHYHNAVYCWARAVLNERYQDYDATASGVKRGEELAEASGDLWRDARWAISRVQDAPHCTVELI